MMVSLDKQGPKEEKCNKKLHFEYYTRKLQDKGCSCPHHSRVKTKTCVCVCECVWVCMCPCVLGALGAETPTKRGFYIMSSLQSYELRSLITTSSLLSVGFTNHMSTLQYRQSVELLAVDSINQSTIHTITVDPTNR